MSDPALLAYVLGEVALDGREGESIPSLAVSACGCLLRDLDNELD
jgi:hypothetical protein